MKKKYIFLVLLGGAMGSFYTFLIHFAKSMDFELKHEDINIDKEEMHFEDAIVKIMNYNGILMDCHEYLSICYNANHYLNDALRLLSKSEINSKEKFLIIEMMHGLDYENYLKFFEVCTDLYIKGLLSDGHILNAITMNVDFNTKIVRSFYKPKIMKALLRIYIKAHDPHLVSMVKWTLLGIVWLTVILDPPPQLYNQENRHSNSNK